MATTMTMTNATESRRLYVVHPLDDAPEVKHSPDNLGRMHMSKSVRLSLFALRGYLFTMILMVAYRVVDQSGFLTHHLH